MPAADKLSALAWRVCAREHGSPKDDPTIVRHLHDLGALESRVALAPIFATLFSKQPPTTLAGAGGACPQTLEIAFR